MARNKNKFTPLTEKQIMDFMGSNNIFAYIEYNKQLELPEITFHYFKKYNSVIKDKGQLYLINRNSDRWLKATNILVDIPEALGLFYDLIGDELDKV